MAKKTEDGGTSLWQLVVERRKRDAIYHDAGYWDARAKNRGGMSRSAWPSNVFNEVWDARQRELLDGVLGDMTGRTVLDVGCGTGRITRHFARAGAAHVVGMDFSPATIEAAIEETESTASDLVPRISFVTGDVNASLAHVAGQPFDDAVILGCLSVACQNVTQLRGALANIAETVKVGGRVVLCEPIHRSPLLRRILDMGIEEWVAAANEAGLHLTQAGRMGFVPVRLVFSVRDLPRWIVKPVFSVGEALLDRFPYLAPVSDYKLLLFTRASP